MANDGFNAYHGYFSNLAVLTKKNVRLFYALLINAKYLVVFSEHVIL